MIGYVPLASLRCRSAWFDDGRLNQKVKIPTLKKLSVMSVGRKFKLRDQRIPKNVLELASQNQSSFCFGLEGRNTNSARASKTVRFTATRWCQGKSSSNVKSVSQSFGQIWLKTALRSTWHRILTAACRIFYPCDWNFRNALSFSFLVKYIFRGCDCILGLTKFDFLSNRSICLQYDRSPTQSN